MERRIHTVSESILYPLQEVVAISGSGIEGATHRTLGLSVCASHM
jgi:hypothetical protein